MSTSVSWTPTAESRTPSSACPSTTSSTTSVGPRAITLPIWRELATYPSEPRLRRHFLEQRNHESVLAPRQSARPSGIGDPSVSDGDSQTPTRSPLPTLWVPFRRSPTPSTTSSPVPHQGTLLPDGAFLDRHFNANEFEWYVQDAWRVKPNLTITFGLRHTLLQTPYETKRSASRAHHRYPRLVPAERICCAGRADLRSQTCSFAPAGPYYNKPGYWPKPKDNFAPRLAIAYSPDTKTSIRAGAGIYYDHYGEALVYIFDQNGSFGMSSAVTNPAGVYGIEGDSDQHLPALRASWAATPFRISTSAARRKPSLPYLYPRKTTSPSPWGLDNKTQDPYSESLDFSIQRRTSRRIHLRSAPTSAGSAATCSRASTLPNRSTTSIPRALAITTLRAPSSPRMSTRTAAIPGATVSAIQYFENVFPFMAGYRLRTVRVQPRQSTPTSGLRTAPSTALPRLSSDIDFYCSYRLPCGMAATSRRSGRISSPRCTRSSTIGIQLLQRRPDSRCGIP